MAHEIAGRRQLQIQRRFGGLGTQRQFVALEWQAFVEVAIQINIEFVRR